MIKMNVNSARLQPLLSFHLYYTSWIQFRSATSLYESGKMSFGVLNPKRFLGRSFKLSWIIASSLSDTVDRGRSLAIYCRTGPLRFSFAPPAASLRTDLQNKSLIEGLHQFLRDQKTLGHCRMLSSELYLISDAN